MTDSDYGTFESAFRRLSGAFRLRLKPKDLEELTRTYFRVLESASLPDVLAAGKACLRVSRTFPKPADWLQALPGATDESAPDCRVMKVDELLEYHRAERLHWQDEPCICLLCQAASVTARPLRFVPEFTSEDRPEQAYDETRKRTLVVGHWAHGDELARWYVARATFFASAPRVPAIVRALAILVGEREPGQEG